MSLYTFRLDHCRKVAAGGGDWLLLKTCCVYKAVAVGAATIGCDPNPTGPCWSMILRSTERRSLLSSLRRAPFIQVSQLVITGVPVPSGEGVGGASTWPPRYIHDQCHCSCGGKLGRQVHSGLSGLDSAVWRSGLYIREGFWEAVVAVLVLTPV